MSYVLKSCNQGQRVDDGEVQCGGGGWVPNSYAVVVAGSPRMTRSNRAENTRIQGGNTDVATNAPAARGAKPPSSCVSVPAAAPSEESPTEGGVKKTGV